MTVELFQQQETQTVENITEQTMREFFERVVNHVTGLSEQAKRVDELSQRVEEMSVRINNLEQENWNLKQDLQAQIEQAHRAEQERDATQIELNSAREHAHALAETIITRDSRVTQLQADLDEARHNEGRAHEDLNVANNRIGELEAHVADLQRQLEEVTSQRDNWQAQSDQHTRQATEFKAQFDRLRSILNPPQSVNLEQVA